MVDLLISYSKILSNELKNIFPLYRTQKDYIIYNVFEYAWDGWMCYVKKCAQESASTLIAGINPGPHGMAQTGVPFGNISAVKNYVGISPDIHQPEIRHKKRPIIGMQYKKEEPSGLLLWNTISSLFPDARNFFSNYFVINYCPLAFFSETGENITPNKLTQEERKHIEDVCSTHFLKYTHTLNITRILAIGRYTYDKIQTIIQMHRLSFECIYIPHPSPLNRMRENFVPTFSHAIKKIK